MKLEDVERAKDLRDRQVSIERTRGAVEESAEEVVAIVPLLFHGEPSMTAVLVDKGRLLHFLAGESQAISLELQELGVELPWVPTIGDQKPLTKGHDL